MPIYEYRCDCGNVFEKILTFEEADSPQLCDKCLKKVNRVQFSLSNFHLKGDWYRTKKTY